MLLHYMLIVLVCCYHVTLMVMLSCTVIGTMYGPGCYETVQLCAICLFSNACIVPLYRCTSTVVLPGLYAKLLITRDNLGSSYIDTDKQSVKL